MTRATFFRLHSWLGLCTGLCMLLIAWLDPLHFGYFGERIGLVAGYAVEQLWVVAGLAPGILAITGGTGWLVRQRRRVARRGASEPTKHSVREPA